MKSFKNQKGITLVALIITIIVLIILAAVTIISVNNMGLVPLAINGTQNYAIAQENEGKLVNDITDLVLGAISNIENGGTGENDSSSEKPEPPKSPQIKDQVGVKVDVNTTMYDEYNNQIVVPAGFKIVAHDGNSVVYNYTKTEDNIPSVQDGIVIEDAENREGKGNQFVWIPTGKIKNNDGTTTEIKLGRYENFTMIDEVLPSPKEEGNASTVTNESPVIDSYFYEYGADDEVGKSYDNAKAKDLKGFLTSATGKNKGGNGGYYIARYEASYDGKGDKPLSQPSTGASDVAPTQKGYLWNKITQGSASEKCKMMYTGDGLDYESDLVNSYAWDTAIVFIQAYANNVYSQQRSLNLDTSKQKPDDTGKREGTTDKVCNIYDMASNCQEWITETYVDDKVPCAFRGGTYANNAGYASSRHCNSTTAMANHFSFRPILYVK